jgi:hypothetical protein
MRNLTEPGEFRWSEIAHAPSPDVRSGTTNPPAADRCPGLRSLGGGCVPPSMAPLAAYAGSRGTGNSFRPLV